MSSFTQPFRQRAFVHAVLIAKGNYSTGTVEQDERFLQVMEETGSLEALFDRHHPGIWFDDELIDRIFRHIDAQHYSFDVRTRLDTNYLTQLQQVQHAPPVLYLRGKPQLLETKVMGVIGLKDADRPQIANDVDHIIERLVAADYTILATLGQRNDAYVHRKAKDYGGRSVAVLQSAITQTRPMRNSAIQAHLTREHLVVSQYPPYRRNRDHPRHRIPTLVGLATHGLVVIDADDTSWERDAIKAAVAHGRQVYVLERNSNQRRQWFRQYRSGIKVVGRE